jgi:hypothetical protein
LIGKQEAVLAPPPVDRIYAIYGINLKTETFYFFKKSQKKGAKKVTDLELDPEVCISYTTANARYNSYPLIIIIRAKNQTSSAKVEWPMRLRTQDRTRFVESREEVRSPWST